MDKFRKLFTTELSRSIFILSFLAPVIAQETRTTTAVLDFEGQGISQKEAATLTDRLMSEMVKTDAVIMMERSLMSVIMEEQGLQLSECFAAECAAEIGALTGVQNMVYGSFGKLGRTYTVDAKMFSVETDQITRSISKSYKGEVDGLFTVIEIVAWELVGLQPPEELLARKKMATKADRTPPTIQITSPVITRGMKKVQKDKTVLVKGKATDASGIFEVLVNGQEAQLSADGSFWTDVRLTVGENILEIIAEDMKGNQSTERFTVLRESAIPLPVSSREDKRSALVTGQYYALIIGIDKYGGEWPRLKNAVHDATGVQKVLQSQYRFDHIITLYDQKATRANIITKLEWLSENLKDEDNLLIYYSGHGEFKQKLNKGYWVPVDAKGRSTVNYISNSVLQTFLNGIQTRHTLLVSDACFSGDIFRSRAESITPTEFDDMSRYYREVYNRMSRQVITSGGVEPVMDGGREGHSVFTYYFLKALKQNEDQYYDAGQLFHRLKIPVSNNSEQTPIFQAIKNTGDEGGQFIFIRK